MANKNIAIVNDFLTSLCESLFLKPSANGNLKMVYPGTKPLPMEVTVPRDGATVKLPLSLPTESLIASGDVSTIKFFPFAESIWKGNSEVLNLLIRLMSSRLHASTSSLLIALMKTKVESGGDSTVGNEVVDILKELKFSKTVGRTASSMFTNMGKVSPFGKDAVTAISLIRDVPSEVGFTRLAHLRFVNTEKETLFGKACEQQTRDILQQLLELIFGNVEDYNCGSNVKSSPSLYSLLCTFASAADRINEVARDLGKYKDENIIIQDSWFDQLEDLEELENFHGRYIQVKFEGNVGTDTASDKEKCEYKETKQMARKFQAGKPVKGRDTQHVEREVVDAHEPEQVEETSRPIAAFGGSAGAVNNGVSMAEAQNPNNDFGSRYSNAMRGDRVVEPNSRGNLRTHGQNISVVEPKNRRVEQTMHAVDLNDNLIYWVSGEPFQCKGDTGVINAYLLADQRGNPVFTDDGEPVMIDEQGREWRASEAIYELAGMYGNSNGNGRHYNGGGQRHNPHYQDDMHSPSPRSLHGGATVGHNGQPVGRQLYTQREMASMTYSQRAQAIREQEEHDRYNQPRGGYHSNQPQQGGYYSHAQSHNQRSNSRSWEDSYQQQPQGQPEPQNTLGFGARSFNSAGGSGMLFD